MIAEHDVLLRFIGAGDAPFDHPDRSRRTIHVNLDAHRRRSGADMIGESERTLPAMRRHGSAQRLEQRARVAIRHRHHHDLRNRERLTLGNSRRARQRRVAGCERIARDPEVVRQRTALDMTLRAPRTEWKCLALPKSVFGGVRVNEQRLETASFGGERLEAPIAVRHGVSHQRDLAFQIDAVLFEPIVVRRIAAGGVDQLSSDIAGRAHAEVCDAGVLRGVRILRIGVFPERRFVDSWRRHRDAHFARPGQQHVVAVQLHMIETPCAIAIGDEVGELLVAHRAGGVRFVGEVAEKGARGIAIQLPRE